MVTYYYLLEQLSKHKNHKTYEIKERKEQILEQLNISRDFVHLEN